ncbi:MAG: hypothetical protein J7J16_02360 [Deltaproteobacteria bacterium]|nr:hypothetical protein [Deltaproteobacteria bacterium]
MIVYPKTFREKVVKKEEPKEVRKEEVKEKVEIWKRLAAEDRKLMMINYYFDTWMWQFKNVPGAVNKIGKLVPLLEKRSTADIIESELRTTLDYLNNGLEVINLAKERIETVIRELWAKRKELK